MKIEDFEAELQQIDPNLAIRPNKPVPAFPDADKIATITLSGSELFSIPNYNIYDERNASYGVENPLNGAFMIHRNRLEALAGVKDKLEQLQDKDYADAFYGRGDYSDAALRGNFQAKQELVEEVEASPKEIGGESNHSPKLHD